MNKGLKETITDERTWIEYHLEGDYYIPNLVLPKQEKVTLNKYGRMRLKYLKENIKAEYSIMLMDGTLTKYLKEIQETAKKRVNQIINQLKEKSDLTEDIKDTDIDLLKEWIEFREKTAFCEMTPQDKKYCIYFDEISERILKNVPEQNKKYVKSQLEQLDKNYMEYLDYWNEKYYRNGFCDGVQLIVKCFDK